MSILHSIVPVGGSRQRLAGAAGALVVPDRKQLALDLLRLLREGGLFPSAFLVKVRQGDAPTAKAQIAFSVASLPISALEVQGYAEARTGAMFEELDDFSVLLGRQSNSDVPIPIGYARQLHLQGALPSRVAYCSLEAEGLPYLQAGPMSLNAVVALSNNLMTPMKSVFPGELLEAIEQSPRLMAERIAALVSLSGFNIEFGAFQLITFGAKRRQRWVAEFVISYEDEAKLAILDGRVAIMAQTYNWWKTKMERWDLPDSVY